MGERTAVPQTAEQTNPGMACSMIRNRHAPGMAYSIIPSSPGPSRGP
jgi:hypothetical protein